MTDEEFYDECGRILGVEHVAHPVDKPRENRRGEQCSTSRTRWTRSLGNGRYAGRGVIRKFGEKVHVAFHTPHVNQMFASTTEALDFLSELTRRGSASPEGDG